MGLAVIYMAQLGSAFGLGFAGLGSARLTCAGMGQAHLDSAKLGWNGWAQLVSVGLDSTGLSSKGLQWA